MSGNKRDLVTLLFNNKENIKILGASGKQTNTIGPSGIGHSAARPKTSKNNAKFSGVAKVLDYMIVDKCVNALEFDQAYNDMVYVEFHINGDTYKATMDDKYEISYELGVPNGYAELIPVVSYALSENSSSSELKTYFKQVVNEYNTAGAATIESVLGFCDTFYYEFVTQNKIKEISIYPEDLSLHTIKQGYETGTCDEMIIFEDIKGKPMFDALDGVQLRTPKRKTANSEISSDFESCLKGEHRIAWEWTENQSKKIPELDTLTDFVPSDVFYSILRKIETRLGKVIDRWNLNSELDNDEAKRIKAIGKDYTNVFVVGKPGTGKTTVGYALGAATGMPTYTVAITKNTEEDTFQGMTKVVNGNFDFVSTDFLDAYENGGIIILEEVNLADPGVIMGALGQAVEAPFILQKDGYKTVRRHPMCVIICTMNIGTNGSRYVSEAFSSRFKQTYRLEDPNEENFIQILTKQGHDPKKCKWVYDAYNRVIAYLKSPQVNAEDVCLNVTLRGCIGALENMSEGDSPKDALRNTLIGKIAEVSLQLAEDVDKDVVNGLPNLK